MALYGKVSARALLATRPFPDGSERQFQLRGRRANAHWDSGESQRAVSRTTWEVAVSPAAASLTGTDGGARVVGAARAAVGSPMFLRWASACTDSHSASPITIAIGPCRPSFTSTERVPDMR